MMSGIGSTIVQGMAFGTGSAIAHRAVGAAAGALSGSSDDGEAVAQQTSSYDQVSPGTLCTHVAHNCTFAGNECPAGHMWRKQ